MEGVHRFKTTISPKVVEIFKNVRDKHLSSLIELQLWVHDRI